MELPEIITFVVQKGLTVTAGLIGVNRIVGAVPSDERQAITQVIIGALLLIAAAAIELFAWRSMIAPRRGGGSQLNDHAQIDERMLLLERALIERLPRPIE